MPLKIRPKGSHRRRLCVGTVNDRELLVNRSKTDKIVRIVRIVRVVRRSAGWRRRFLGCTNDGTKTVADGKSPSVRLSIRPLHVLRIAIAVGCEEHTRDYVFDLPGCHRITRAVWRNYRGRVVAPGRGVRAGLGDGIAKRTSRREVTRAFGELSKSAHRRCDSSYRAFHHNAEARRSSLSSSSAAFWRRSAAFWRCDVDSSSITSCDST